MLEYSVGLGYSALDAQAWRDKLDGFAVVSGLGVSVDSGLTVSIAAGTATVGETSGSVDTVSLGSSTTTTLSSANPDNPRKDTIYIDTSGTIQVETGVAEAADPSGNTRFDTFQPEPPLPSTDGTVLAEVWVGAGDTTLEAADIRDRRVPADLVGQTIHTGEVNTDTVDLVGTGNINIRENGDGSVSLIDESGTEVILSDSGLEAPSITAVRADITETTTSAEMSSSQDISSGTITKMQFDTTDFDELGDHDETNAEISVSRAGTYLIQAVLEWGVSSVDSIYQARVHINGGVVKVAKHQAGSTDRQTVPVAEVEQLSSGDVIDIRGFQDTGGTESVFVSESGFQVIKLG